ncbi:hypothetical protein [Pseudomonas entomophila]|uniref:hypothetical protein n=1 Tax=Pseudomonas entomophila TaxID=312306 RepID=UPI003EC03648
MDRVDPLIEERIRAWQARRLAIKDQMQSSPERTLELSRVLDEMDEEHERLLQAAPGDGVFDKAPSQVGSFGNMLSAKAVGSASQAEGEPLHDSAPAPAPVPLSLRLDLTAATVEDLRRLVDLAFHELEGQLVAGPTRPLTGHMAGTLGRYRFALRKEGSSNA